MLHKCFSYCGKTRFRFILNVLAIFSAICDPHWTWIPFFTKRWSCQKKNIIQPNLTENIYTRPQEATKGNTVLLCENKRMKSKLERNEIHVYSRTSYTYVLYVHVHTYKIYKHFFLFYVVTVKHKIKRKRIHLVVILLCVCCPEWKWGEQERNI